jgi:hypothetical protein
MLAALVHAILVKHEERYHHFVWDEIFHVEQPEVQVSITSENSPLLVNRQNMRQY